MSEPTRITHGAVTNPLEIKNTSPNGVFGNRFNIVKELEIWCESSNAHARVLNISLAVRSEPERISDRLEDPVSHAPLAFNSQGEHSEGKPALAFSTPTGISLGGSSEPLTLSPDHKPLGGCEPKERLDGMKLDQRERKHDQSDLVSEAGREGIEAHGAKIKAASAFRSALWLLAIKSEVTFGRGETSTWDNLSLGYDLNSTFKKEPDQANQEIGSDEGERELLLKEGESLLLVAIKW
ncbi:hypothetical protein Tco_1253510 [Tanacetum coccineum]